MWTLRIFLIISVSLTALNLNAQNDVVLNEVPGIRNREEFVMQFFTDYKGMTWARTFNKIFRINGGKDETCDISIANKYLIKEVQFYDSFFYINYHNTKLLKLNIKTRHVTEFNIPSQFKKLQIMLGERNYFLVLDYARKKIYRLGYSISKKILDSSTIDLDSIKLFTYLNNDNAVIKDSKKMYLYDMKTNNLTSINGTFDFSRMKNYNNKILLFADSKPLSLTYTKGLNGNFDYKVSENIASFDIQNSFITKNYSLYKESYYNDFYYLEDNLGIIKRFRFVNTDGVPYKFQTIYTVFEDNKNNIFISTEKGIFLFNVEASRIIDYYIVTNKRGEKNTSTLEVRNAFYNERSKELLLGLKHEGIYKYKFDTTDKHFRYSSKINLGGAFNYVNTITKTYLDKDGRLWLCTNGSISRYSGNTNQQIGINAVWDIEEDDNNYWLASSTMGLHSINKKTDKIIKYSYSGSGSDSKEIMWDILQMGNYLHLSTPEGIFVFDKAKRTFNNPVNNIFSNLFTDQMCWQETFDFRNKDNIIVSTQASGLYSISANGTNKRRILQGVDEIFQCYSGPIGNIASSGHNLFFFEKCGSEYIRFDAGNYPIPGNIGFHGFCEIGEDKLCVTGANGFSIIKLNEFKDHIRNLKPRFFVQSIEVLNHKTYHYPEEDEVIRLTHGHNNIKIIINSDYLGTTTNMNITYFISGRKDTLSLSNTNEISFNNLAPGTYGLNIFCQTANGIWNKKQIRTTIIISPPWYENTFAKITYILFSIIVLWTIFNWYKKQSERTKKFQLIKLESELKSLRSQMNPHFMFNALNAIQEYVLKSDKENANIYLSDFSRLIRQTLDNSSKETITLKEEINWLENYLNLEKLRYKDKFEYKIEIQTGLPMDIEVPTMILQPFVENAINHGIFNKKDHGHVSVRIKRQTEFLLECIIEDDGIGFEASSKITNEGITHESKGLSITWQRMKYINEKYKTKGKIDILNMSDVNVNTGTKVIILLPCFYYGIEI